MVVRKVKRLARICVRAWRVRLTDIPQGTAPAETRPRALSISEPSGGTGARLLKKRAAASDLSTRAEVTVEETCRRSLSPKQFYIAETVRGVQIWRSGPIRTHEEAQLALGDRARLYLAQGYQLERWQNCHTVRQNGVTIEIRIMKDAKKEET